MAHEVALLPSRVCMACISIFDKDYMKTYMKVLFPCVAVALSVLCIQSAQAQRQSNDAPANSYKPGYGGWFCVRGYAKRDGLCAPVSVPPNAYLDSTGSDWKCERGYLKQDDACREVVVPLNAFLLDTQYGLGWQCNRGYQRQEQQCDKIVLPEHAYLKNVGDDWSCARGYVKEASACTALRVPDNAHINWAGNGWDCDAPYRKRNQVCE